MCRTISQLTAFSQTEGIWKLVACMFNTQPATTVTLHKILECNSRGQRWKIEHLTDLLKKQDIERDYEQELNPSRLFPTLGRHSALK